MSRIAGSQGGRAVRLGGDDGEIPALADRISNPEPWNGRGDSVRRAV